MSCGDYDCYQIGNSMGSLSYSYMDGDWSCTWHTICAGENFGNGDAWVSRNGGDGNGQSAIDEAKIAAHEAGHTALNTSNDTSVDTALDYCFYLIGG